MAGVPKHIMAPDLFEQIVRKIKQETPNALISLYNWGESTLHPAFAEIVAVANRYGFRPSISTNLNTDIDPLLQALDGVCSIRISLSGFRQQEYEKHHTGGDIERVKANMGLLRRAMDAQKAKTNVHVAYHCYLTNLGDDYKQMKALCTQLGFMLFPFWPYLMPYEAVVAIAEGAASRDEEGLGESFPIPLSESLNLVKGARGACSALTSLTSINADGSVSICCATHSAQNVIGSFLSLSRSDLGIRKQDHPFCKKCMAFGLHRMESEFLMHRWNRYVQRLGVTLPREVVMYGLSNGCLNLLRKLFGDVVAGRMLIGLKRIVFHLRRS